MKKYNTRNFIIILIMIEFFVVGTICQWNKGLTFFMFMINILAIWDTINYFNKDKSYYSFFMGRSFDKNSSKKERYIGFLVQIIPLTFIFPIAIIFSYFRNFAA